MSNYIYHDIGKYVFRITKQGWTNSKERNLPMLVFEGYPTYKITKNHEGEDQFEDVSEDPNKATRTIRLFIDSSRDDIMDFVIKKLRYAGFEGNSFSDLNLVNADIRATCEHGEKYEEWDFTLPPFEEREVNELDTAMNRKLDTLFGKRLKGGKPKQSSPEAQAQEEPQASEDAAVPARHDDEVPF